MTPLSLIFPLGFRLFVLLLCVTKFVYSNSFIKKVLFFGTDCLRGEITLQHPITNDNKTFTKTPYNGNDAVKIGNGSGMAVIHIGTAKYSNPCMNKKYLLKSPFTCS